MIFTLYFLEGAWHRTQPIAKRCTWQWAHGSAQNCVTPPNRTAFRRYTPLLGDKLFLLSDLKPLVKSILECTRQQGVLVLLVVLFISVRAPDSVVLSLCSLLGFFLAILVQSLEGSIWRRFHMMIWVYRSASSCMIMSKWPTLLACNNQERI